LTNQIWTVDSYLTQERNSPSHYEYANGKRYPLPTVSANHEIIINNTFANLYTQLRRRDYRVFLRDMRLKTVSGDLYVYPSLMIVRGEPLFEGGEKDTLLNPTVIIEVRSSTTGALDFNTKIQSYRQLYSLQEYILIAADHLSVEHYTRQSNNQWLLSDVSNIETTLTLAIIQCNLFMADVYERVIFSVGTVSLTAFTGTWIGKTQGYEMPAHVWDITEYGPYLLLSTRWESGTHVTRFHAEIVSGEQAFKIMGIDFAKATLIDDQHFVMPNWVFHKYHTENGENAGYDVVFSRPGAAELTAQTAYLKYTGKSKNSETTDENADQLESGEDDGLDLDS